MKQKKQLLVASLACLGLMAGSFEAANPIALKAEGGFDPSVFSLAKGSGQLSDSYSISEESIISHNGGQRMNFAVREDVNAIGDYTVTAKGHGETNWPVSKGIHIGIVPWYIDDANYLLVYMEWSPTERPSGMRVVQFTGAINGKDPFVYKDGSFKASQWNDAWMDGGNSKYAIAPSTEWTFSVSKKRSEGGDADELFAYINGNQIGFFSFRDLETYEAKPAKVGVYAWNETTTYTSLEVTSLNNPNSFVNLEEGKVAKSSSSPWAVESLGYAVNETAGGEADKTMMLSHNEFEEGNYQVTAGLPTNSLVDGSKAGLVAWYQDASNYALAYVEKIGDAYKAHIKGKTAIVTNPGDIDPTLFDEEIALNITGEDLVISAKRMSSNIALLVNGENVLSVKNTSFAAKGLSGLCASKINTTFTFAVTSCDYVPFDWYNTSLGGESFLASAAKEGEISRNGGDFIFTDEAVTADTNDWAGLVKESGKWEDINVVASFAETSQNQVVGIYSFFANEENYAAAALTKDGLLIRTVVSGEKTDVTTVYPDGFALGGAKTMISILKGRKLTIRVDDVDLVIDFPLGTLPYDISPYAGFFIGAKGNTISSFSVSGFANDGIVDGPDGWLFRGPRPSTWSFNEDMSALTGRYNGGTTWLHTSALKSQEAQSFHMGAEMKVLDKTGSEYKTGLVPYYQNDSNYVIVWISMWAGASPKVNVTARVNGAVLGGNEFNEVDAGVDYLGSTIQFESEIDGDMIRVYLNASATPVFASEFKGLSSRSLAGAKVGFNLHNTSAKFENITLKSDKRIFVFDEKPVISETGNRPTTGVVGNNIKLPMYTATNSRFDPIDAVVSVKDPTGQDVAIVKNGFVPTMEGDYVVRVTAVDDYGNEADPIAYAITVRKQGTSEPTSEVPPTSSETPTSSTPSPSRGGCGGAIGGGIAVAALAPLGLALVLALRKRK